MQQDNCNSVRNIICPVCQLMTYSTLLMINFFMITDTIFTVRRLVIFVCRLMMNVKLQDISMH